MKILVYSDAHANKQALESLKKTDDFITADMRIFLGDAIGIGPDTNYAVEFVSKYSKACLIGNNDSYPIFGISQEEGKNKPQVKLEHIEELKKELSAKNKEIIRSWPKEYILKVAGKTMRFLHYKWQSETETAIIPKSLNVNQYVAMFGDKYDYTFFGHFHYKFHFEYNNKKYFSVGSAGLKYPGQYTVIEVEGKTITVSYKSFEYDVKKFKKKLLHCKHKAAKDFVKTRLASYLTGSMYE